MIKLRTIILEDEIETREWLIKKLSKFPELEIVGWAETIDDAYRLIAFHKPDAAFMDIQLIGGDSFQLLRRLQQNSLKIPYIVMTTGYPDYIFTALNDYRHYIVQYVVKPYVENWEQKFRKGIDAIIAAQIVAEANNPSSKLNHIFINQKGTLLKIDFDEIIYLESAGSGETIIVTKSATHQVDLTLNKCLELLPQTEFFRISRNNIVKLNAICRIYREERTIDVLMSNKTKNLGIGNQYYTELLQLLPLLKTSI
jgi:DNA-binding LytR/AlgR family response regulator